MKNLNKLGFILSVGTLSALSFSLGACSDDPETSGGTAGKPSTAGSPATAGSSGSAGTPSTAGSGGSSAGKGGSGGSGGSTAGSGGATAGSGGATAGGGAGGAGTAGGGAGGGGGAGPMCTDTEDPENMESATCTDFCDDWDAKCKAIDAAKYADKAACLADCKTFSVAALCCRAYHVNNEPASQHCAHAKGEGPCTGK